MHALLCTLFAFLHLASCQMLGTSLTTLNGSDRQSDFPTTYNANNAALNAGKIENSTTTLPLLTTLANLATIGTITTGVWHGTAVTPQYGGTGSTTLSANQLFAGNGIGNVVSIPWGTSGQFLQSNGPGVLPSFTTSSIDQTASYAWTNNHTWSASSTFQGILNVKTLNVNGQGLTIVKTATSTTYTTAGTYTWVKPANVSNVFVTLQGAGGGGGSGGNGGTSLGGGGGAGCYAQATVSVSGNVTVVVGAAGAGGAVNANSGATGGNSSFAGDVTVTAAGGVGGAFGNNTNGTGGSGGSCTNADLGYTGNTGWDGAFIKASYSGWGADSSFGMGGRPVTGNTGTGANASGFGAGGGGASAGGGNNAAGGNGSGGFVVIQWVQ